MGFSQTGILHTILETTQVSARFTKREFVLTVADNPKYPQLVLMQLTGDRVSQLDGLQIGDDVRVEFSLRGREWRSPSGDVKYFNSLDAWKVEATRVAPPRGERSYGNFSTPDGGGGGGDAQPNYGGADPDGSDLPFGTSDIASESAIPRSWRGWP